MAYVAAHARAQDQADQTLRLTIQGYERRLGVEHAASREPHDVIEEAQRSAESMVLVVDLGIDVAAIRSGNDGRRGLVVAVYPWSNFNFGMRGNFLGRNFPQRQRHEQARMPLKSRL